MISVHRSIQRRSVGTAALVTFLSLALIGGSACDNFLGLEDWQRDWLNFGLASLGTGGALATALLTGGTTNTQPSPDPLPGVEGAQGEQGEQGVPGADGLPGADGADGQDGADGTELFHVFVDDIFGYVQPFEGSPSKITEPVLGFAGAGTPEDPDIEADRLAFRVMIPPDYAGENPVTLRLAFRRLGGTIGPDPFAFNIYVRRMVDGSNTVEQYVNPPLRTIYVTPPAAGQEFEFQVIDLPINVAVPDGLGGAPLSSGDYIAVELLTVGSDGGSYMLLGVEFYETTVAPPVDGATIA